MSVYQRFYHEVRDLNGNAVAGATCKVYNAGTDTLATIYDASSPDSNPQGASNPIVTQADGVVAFFALDGQYDLQISGGGIASATKRITLSTADAGVGAVAATDLANQASGFLGASLVGFNVALTYLTGTLGKFVKDFYTTFTSTGASLMGYLAPYTGSVATSQSQVNSEIYSVFRWMTPAQIADIQAGTLGQDVGAALNAAWAWVKPIGGTLVLPPGKYYKNSQWVCDVDQTAPHNYSVIGYGAEIYDGSSVTGHSMKVYKSYNNYGVKVEGLAFNQSGNGTVNGAIQLRDSWNSDLKNISVIGESTKATYSCVELSSDSNNGGALWATIEGLSTRNGATPPKCGVRLIGSSNACKIVNSQIGNCVSAIILEGDGLAVTNTPNGLLVSGCAFESLTDAIVINNGTPSVGGLAPTLMPNGLRVVLNRGESITGNFIKILGALVTDPSFPPVVSDNFLGAGSSVASFISNPNNQIVIVRQDAAYSGTSGVTNLSGGPFDTRVMATASGKNFRVDNGAGSSSWDNGHYVMGVFHFWNDSNGLPRWKSSAPASALDGAQLITSALPVTLVSVAAATSNAVTHKVKFNISGTDYYFVASTSAT